MSKRIWIWPLVALAAAGALPLSKVVVRAWVDRKIERNVGDTLPEFAPTSTDERVSAATLRGKVVVVHFFRSFCGSCERQKPVVRELEAELDARDVVLISVMTDRVEGYPESATAATLGRAGYAHPIVMADQGFLDRFHGAEWANVTPIWYVADRAGRIVATLRGTQEKADVLNAIETARRRG